MDDTPEELLTQQLLKESREELVRADAKASTLFGIEGVIVGIVVGAIIAGKWSPVMLDDDIEWLWWVGGGFVVTSLLSLASAIYPSLESEHAQGRVTYFGHVVGYGKNREALRSALKLQAGEGGRTIEQVQAISGIAWTKYQRIQFALWVYGLGLAACLASVLIP